MCPITSDTLLYFVHVPKTGGTFATNTLKTALGKRFIRQGHVVPSSCAQPWMQRFDIPDFTEIPREKCIFFTIVRNPFDLLVSMYAFGFPYWAPRYVARAHRRIEWPFASFREYVHKLAKYDDYPWICPSQKHSLYFQLFDDDGRFIPSYVLRKEALTEGLRQLLQELNVSYEIPNVQVNTTKHHHYRDYFDDELKEIVETRYRGDLQAFGYNFDGHDGRVLFCPKDAHFNHQAGAYSALPERTCDPISPTSPAGRFADIELHPWGDEILSCYTGAELAQHLLKRLRRRFVPRN